MDEKFSQFKKRIWIGILIKCIVAGLATGFVAVNAVLLPCSLLNIRLFAIYYVLIALGGIALGGGIAFLCLRTNDDKIARRLDDEFGLSERVQTAHKYEGHDGVMLDRQRDDATAALAAIPAKKLKFKHVAMTAVCAAVLVLGIAAVPVITCTIPTASATTPPGTEKPVEPPRDITDWEWAALDDLIDYVKASRKADAATKTCMVDELQALRSVLMTGVSQSSLAAFVQTTVTNIRNGVKDINDGGGVSESQQELNSEEERYVVNKLYEIFGLRQPGEGDPDDETPPDEGGDEKDPNNPIEGDLDIDDTPFFDPELGMTTLGAVRAAYYERVQKALAEGTISQDEWEHIMVTYFADLIAD